MNSPDTFTVKAITTIATTTIASAVTMLVFDLTWLAVIARGFYETSMGSLKRPTFYLPAAGLFYAFYVGAIVTLAVIPATSTMDAARRGAILGLLAYGTYELTNWAVLRDWPWKLVAVDMAWGVILTGVVSFVGRWVYEKMSGAPI